ncbi:ATP-NAD kinase-like domain-containing protein [Chytriomyces sp. MP71]|nr:ATP-NAD kinase-like domain-containing protein [Chytriomyces sp. MP71]
MGRDVMMSPSATEVHVLVNTWHGTSSATSERVCSVLAATGTRAASLHLTRSAGHCVALASTAVKSSISSPSSPSVPTTTSRPSRILLVVVGGDGTLHEAINGAIQASSSLSQSSPLIHIAIVPNGSGNALAISLGIDGIEHSLRILEKYLSIVNADGDIPKSLVSPLRVASFAVAPPPISRHLDAWPLPQTYIFCVVSYGLHAQIVKQSELLRFLGNKRFQYVAWANIAFLSQYWARLWTLDARKRVYTIDDVGTEKIEFVSLDETAAQSERSTHLVYQGEAGYSYFLCTKMTHLEKGFHISPHSCPSSSEWDLISTTTPLREQLVQLLTGAMSTAKHLNLSFSNDAKVRGLVFEPVSPRGFVGWLFSWLWFVVTLGAREWGSADVCVDGEMWSVERGKAIWLKDLEDEKQFFHVLVPSSREGNGNEGLLQPAQ